MCFFVCFSAFLSAGLLKFINAWHATPTGYGLEPLIEYCFFLLFLLILLLTPPLGYFFLFDILYITVTLAVISILYWDTLNIALDHVIFW